MLLRLIRAPGCRFFTRKAIKYRQVKYISLSSDFTIWNSKSCSYLCRMERSEYRTIVEYYIPIPPIVGYVLSRIGDMPIKHSIEFLSERTGLSPDALRKYIEALTENDCELEWKFGDTDIIFPKKLLIKTSDRPEPNFFDHPNFDVFSDFIIGRPPFPLNVNLMVTTRCTTNCIYCYADKHIGEMPLEMLTSILKELKAKGCINVSLTGGDIFARTGWQGLMEMVVGFGFNPFVSTKTPLSLEDLIFLKNLGIKFLQFSLDSISDETLSLMIGADVNYKSAVSTMFEHCIKLGIKIQVRTVITRHNQEIEGIENLFKYLQGFKSVREWDLTPALYTGRHKNELYFRPDREKLGKIVKFLKNKSTHISFSFNKMDESGYSLQRYQTCKDLCSMNSRCLGNVTTLSILSNGKCTLCETLYGNPEYLLGDLNNETIEDIWNGDKAMSLYKTAQASYDESSPCFVCKEFRNCRGTFGSKVCFADISKLGKSRFWPDPRCPESQPCELIL